MPETFGYIGAIAIIIGVVCLSLKEKADPFVKVVDAVNEISMKIISFVMYFTPIGVFTSIATVIYSNGAAAILALGKLLDGVKFKEKLG